MVVYEDEFNGSTTDHDILFRIFTPAGTPVLGPNPYNVVGGNGNGMEAWPDVAALKNGGFVVVWEDDGGPSGADIRATIYNNAGGTVTTACWSKPRRSGARARRMWWRWATAASS